MMSLFFFTTIVSGVKLTSQPSSHNWPMEISEALFNPLKICTSFAFALSFRSGSVPASVAWIVAPFGKATLGPMIGLMFCRIALSQSRQKCLDAPLSAFALITYPVRCN